MKGWVMVVGCVWWCGLYVYVDECDFCLHKISGMKMN